MLKNPGESVRDTGSRESCEVPHFEDYPNSVPGLVTGFGKVVEVESQSVLTGRNQRNEVSSPRDTEPLGKDVPRFC